MLKLYRRFVKWYKIRDLRDTLSLAITYKFRAMIDGDTRRVRRLDLVCIKLRKEIREIEVKYS